MQKSSTSTRRTFIQAAGAALSVPVAAAAYTNASATPAGESIVTRLARLEDREAIRALNQAFARWVNAGDREALAELYVDPSGMQIDAALRALTSADVDGLGAIQIAPDRRTATASLPCSADFADEIGPSCTVVEMARAQGGGVVRRSERGVIEHRYVRHEGVWRIHRSAYHVAQPTVPTTS